MKKEVIYIEPENYFPKEIRKKYKLGEYNTDEEDEREDKRTKNKSDDKEK